MPGGSGRLPDDAVTLAVPARVIAPGSPNGIPGTGAGPVTPANDGGGVVGGESEVVGVATVGTAAGTNAGVLTGGGGGVAPGGVRQQPAAAPAIASKNRAARTFMRPRTTANLRAATRACRRLAAFCYASSALVMRSVWARVVVPLVLSLLVGTWAPARLVGRDADAAFDGRLDATLPRARALAQVIEAGLDADDFTTGSPRYDGEWALVTHQMAILALGQVVLAHAHRADVAALLMPAIRRATDVLLAEETRSFATAAWGSDALLSLDDPSRGDAWLGYVALALGMSRAVDPEFAHVAVHDAIVRALSARRERDPQGRPETYPRET